MNILLLGGGGREHAILRALLKSKDVSRIDVAPGNAGICMEAICHDVNPVDTRAVLSLAETLLRTSFDRSGSSALRGDRRRSPQRGVRRSSARAGRERCSKEASASRRPSLRRHSIPRRISISVRRAQRSPRQFAKRRPPFVVKADGLAAGKGVIVAESPPTRKRRPRRCSRDLSGTRKDASRRRFSARRRTEPS